MHVSTRNRIVDASGLLTALVLLVYAVAAAAVPQSTQSAEELLQRAIHQEEALGDAASALELYTMILDRGGGAAEILARAQFRLASLLDKLGRTTEARPHWQHLAGLRPTGAWMEDVVRQAQDRLAAAAEAGGAGIVARQLWAGPNVDPFASPTPDGRYLFCIDWTTGNLAVRDVASGEMRPITDKGTWIDSQEFGWFAVARPDGRGVAYGWQGTDAMSWELRVLELDLEKHFSGNDAPLPAPRSLYEVHGVFPVPMAWTPDGKQILTLLVQPASSQLALVPSDGGPPTPLKSFDWRAPAKASISPNGRFVAYDFQVSEEESERDIFVLALDGSRQITLVDGPADDTMPLWTPDGRGIFFLSDRSGAMDGWFVPVREGSAAGPPRLVKPDFNRVMPLGFSADGDLFHLVNTRMNDIYEVEFADLPARGGRQPQRVLQRFVGANTGGSWSPDGSRLSYLSSRRGIQSPVPQRVLMVHDAVSGTEHEVPLDGFTYLAHASWSLDGRSLVMVAQPRNSTRAIYRVDPESGAVEMLAAEPGQAIYEPAFSPDRSTVYYRRLNEEDSGTFELVARRLDGEESPRVLYSSRRTISSTAVSADGRWIAFQQPDPDTQTFTVLMMPTSGGEPREVFRTRPDGDGVTDLMFGPDGKSLIFGRTEQVYATDTDSELWRLPLDGGPPERLGIRGNGRIRNLSLHPDGERLFFTAGQQGGEVWVLENLLDAATR